MKILMSRDTAEKLSRNDFFYLDLDDIRVKGKTETVKVFELMRPNFLTQQRLVHEFIEIFPEGRQSYVNRDFDRARKLFGECLQLKPEDKSTNLYVERVE